MLAQCSVFIAASLDGFIAREDGSIDWLMEANTRATPGEDGGYKAFIASVDALVMGRHTFEKVITFDPWPYGTLPVIVMSSQPLTIPQHLKNTVSTSKEMPKTLLQRLTTQGFKHLYIDGGVTIHNFIKENLINNLTITITPILLGSGRPLFSHIAKDIELQLIRSKELGGGFVQLQYTVKTKSL